MDEGCHQKGSLGDARTTSGGDGNARHRQLYFLFAVASTPYRPTRASRSGARNPLSPDVGADVRSARNALPAVEFRSNLGRIFLGSWLLRCAGSGKADTGRPG